MKKMPEKKAALPPGIVPFKGASAKLKRWLKEFGEPDNLASAGPHVRFRQTATRK